jgi:hypothetical protein
VPSKSLVGAFRMPLSGIGRDPERPYLSRARVMCARGEALGARLVAWSATLLAMAWELDGVEEAIELAAGLRTEGGWPQDAWACGIAEGELEPLSPEGQRMHLAWGEALLVAASLARVARPGEVLIDGDVSVVRTGRLGLLASRSASDGGRRVRGWQLDLERPWRATAGGGLERPVGAESPLEELSSADVLELTEAALVATRPPSERCRGSLALAMALAAAARPQEALMEGLEALARAREDKDPKALAACYALLAKLYASVGKNDAAGELRDLAKGAARPGPP